MFACICSISVGGASELGSPVVKGSSHSHGRWFSYFFHALLLPFFLSISPSASLHPLTHRRVHILVTVVEESGFFNEGACHFVVVVVSMVSSRTFPCEFILYCILPSSRVYVTIPPLLLTTFAFISFWTQHRTRSLEQTKRGMDKGSGECKATGRYV